MFRKKTILIFILILQFQFIYSISITFFNKSFSNVISEINVILNDKEKFKNEEEILIYNISVIKPLLSDLINKNNINKFNSKRNINFFNTKNLMLLYLEVLQEQINSFKLDFIQFKKENIKEINNFTEIFDLNENLKIIEDFLIKNEEKTKFFLSEPNNCESKLLYKKYIKEIDFKKFEDVILEIWYDMLYVKDLIKFEQNAKKLLISNKINILRKVNDIRKNFKQNKLENIEFDFEKYDINKYVDSSFFKNDNNLLNEEKIEYIITKVQNIKLRLNGKLKVEFDKLIKVMNKLENISEIIDKSLKESNNEKTKNIIFKIDLYKVIVVEFLKSLKLFFSVFNNKNKNLEFNTKDYDTKIILLIFKTILYDEKDIKSNVDYIFKTLLGIEKLKNEDLKKIQTYWNKDCIYYTSFSIYHKLWFILESFCELNDFIFSEENELKFKEILSEDLNNKLKKFYDMLKLFLNYLNTKDHNIRKNMIINILQKLYRFLKIDYFNDRYRYYLIPYFDKCILENSDIENFIEILLTELNYEKVEITQLHNLEKYEIIFLSIIFDMFKEIGNNFSSNKSNSLNILKNDIDMDISLKNLKKFISKLINLH